MTKNEKYMSVAEVIAGLSKDDSTKVGALVVGSSGEFRASGWNGAARGCSADEDERFKARPEKYFWVVHAEANAIANAAAVGTPLRGATIVVTHFPCMACANLIVQAGITHVVTKVPSVEFAERWSEQIIRAQQLFDECGVTVDVV